MTKSARETHDPYGTARTIGVVVWSACIVVVAVALVTALVAMLPWEPVVVAWALGVAVHVVLFMALGQVVGVIIIGIWAHD